MKPHLAFVLAAAAFAAGALSIRAQDEAKPAPTFDVVVQGQVHKPGHYSITSDFSVIDTIELAAGFTDSALRSGITVTRSAKEGPPKTTLDYSDIQLNNGNADFKLKPGDVIFVPADPTYGK